ncbi:unnamed protein product [Lepeophtheirus salmonis]|uniref:(salmon louse) hypothetical protein n=1 Tax=Lepeophtheirus salmonis TaxID=72036 RepID=A0A7R8D193_LEPSM|nr:unnamed protein product [Lepeophtheirus salmonis]CAF2967338.1 unnamed protein product [Lepeophtheirus salmonis]
MNNIAMYPSLMGSPMGNVISPSVRHNIGKNFCSQLYNSPAENKENLTSSTDQGMLPSPGFAPNPYFLINNGFGIGSPSPFYPQLLQAPQQSPPFTPILNSPNETSEEANGITSTLRTLNTARISLTMEINVMRKKPAIETNDRLKNTEEQVHNDPPSLQSYAESVGQCSPLALSINPTLLRFHHPALQLELVDAITPKSKKSGQSILLKSNVLGFNKIPPQSH